MEVSEASLLPRNETTLHCPYVTLDPKSLIVSRFSDSHKSQFLRLTTQSFVIERGPRYQEYSDLRERRLRIKNMTTEQRTRPVKERNEKLQHGSALTTTPKKQQKFSSKLAALPNMEKGSSILTQSVRNFSSVQRKENRKPAVGVMERLSSPQLRLLNSGTARGGNKPVNPPEKSSGRLMRWKSYANMEELKGSGAGNAINGENMGGGKVGRGVGKGYRQF